MSGFSFPYFAGAAIQALSFGCYQDIPATTGQNSFFQLWNPPTSTAKLVINGSRINSVSASAFQVIAATGSVQATGTTGTGANKNAAGGAGQASFIFGATASVVTARWFAHYNFQPSMNPVNIILNDDAVIVPPGFGYLVFCPQTNTQFSAVLDWVEIPK